MNDLTHLSLFTGIGGIDLAAEWAGFHTIGQVEQNKYALRVLRKRFGRGIPRWTDIRDLSADDVKRRTGIDSPTFISGGFPCQPFSCAGKRRGKEDDRHLWPEMFRVVRELRPAWVLGENVAGIVSMELDGCIADLEGEGYQVRAFLIPACGVGALHRRERVFIVANTRNPKRSRYGFIRRSILPDTDRTASMARDSTPPNTNQFNDDRAGRCSGDVCRKFMESPEVSGSKTLANPHSSGLRKQWGQGPIQAEHSPTKFNNWWSVEPAVGRVAHGVPHRVDRLRCLGNAVVPQQVYPILAGIAQVETEINKG